MRVDGVLHKLHKQTSFGPLHPHLVGLQTLLRDELPVTGDAYYVPYLFLLSFFFIWLPNQIPTNNAGISPNIVTQYNGLNM